MFDIFPFERFGLDALADCLIKGYAVSPSCDGSGSLSIPFILWVATIEYLKPEFICQLSGVCQGARAGGAKAQLTPSSCGRGGVTI
jgi:hypothetical protein